jgi:hypothetical protein
MLTRIEITIETDEAVAERLLDGLARLLPLADAKIRATPALERRRQAASAPPDLIGFVERIDPKSHTDLATVFAYVADVKGLPGLDVATANAWSQLLDWSQPADWRFIVDNATRSGHLQKIGRGLRTVGPKGRSLLKERLATPEEVVERTR